MARHLIVPAVVILIAIGSFTCKETSTEGDVSPAPSFSYHYGKCLPLPRFNISDSIFVYSFTDSLIIDFSVVANCCPDSNRFAVSHIMNNDTIIISVVDTAENICRCICPYMIRAEYAGLSNDHYIVRCNLTVVQSSGITDAVHMADVYRQERNKEEIGQGNITIMDKLFRSDQ